VYSPNVYIYTQCGQEAKLLRKIITLVTLIVPKTVKFKPFKIMETREIIEKGKFKCKVSTIQEKA